MEVFGFRLGKFPLRYLGVPIMISKSVLGLVEKMTARIRYWSSRNLSYQGRVCLINSVLEFTCVLGLNSHNSQEDLVGD